MVKPRIIETDQGIQGEFDVRILWKTEAISGEAVTVTGSLCPLSLSPSYMLEVCRPLEWD
jgi:hypothetical protein